MGDRPALRLLEDGDSGAGLESGVVVPGSRHLWRGRRSPERVWLVVWHPTIADPSDPVAGGWFLVRAGIVVDRAPAGGIGEITVTDSGLLAFIGSDPDGEDPGGTVVARRNERTLVEHAFPGPAWSLAVAPDERSIAVTTAGQRGNEVAVLDVPSGSLRWQREGVGTGVHAVRFEGDALIALDRDPRFHPITDDVGRYEHAIEDGAVEPRPVRREAIRVGRAPWAFRAIREELLDEPPDAGRALELLAAVDRELAALAVLRDRRPWVRQEQAQAERLAGEVLAAAGDERGALERWDRALALDPGVGIARRAAALRERSGS